MKLSRALVATVALCALSAASAFAGGRNQVQGVPEPPQSTIPSSIMLVGASGGVADPRGAFIVVARDLASNPLPGAHVDVDFSQLDDARLSTSADPGLTVDCGFLRVTAITDQFGVAHFSIRGGSRPGPPTTFAPRGRIYVDGVLQSSTIPVSTPDLDGSGGVGATDLALWIEDYLLGTSPVRSDFNGNGILTAADLATWLDVFLAGGSSSSGPGCP